MKIRSATIGALLLVTGCDGEVVDTIDGLAGRQSVVQMWDERADPYLHHQSVVPPIDSGLRRAEPYPD